MSSPATVPTGGFSLFPNTGNRPPSRSQVNWPRAATPQNGEQSSASDMSPPRPGRQTPVERKQSVREGKRPATNPWQAAIDAHAAQQQRNEHPAERAGPAAAPAAAAPAVSPSEVPPRCETAFSEAQTLVRSNSNRSRSSIAKMPIIDPEAPSTAEQSEPALRSMFPQYNHALPVDRQEYYPTQTSPTHIPRAAISRPLYSPTEAEVHHIAVSPPARDRHVRSPMSAGSARPWVPKPQEAPVVPPTSTTEEIQSLWKVANGWKASASEGRVYCLKMTNEKDAPVYTLSSTTQPFYNIRLDPTSASAYVTLARHDPNKPYKGAAPGAATSPGGSASTATFKAEGKNWQEALTTTLEEESRKHPPNDGLVSLLYPTAAAKMALDRPGDPTAVATAERECARLVWDDDSGSHYLVHPALAMPFCVTVERNPAWSRTEYTLEHVESPQHLARLTRDGTGQGWLEVDTAIAAKVDAVYLVDVAVAALLLVAHTDARYARVEVFEPPPQPPPAVLGGAGGAGGRHSRQSSRAGSRASVRLGLGGKDRDGSGGGRDKNKKRGSGKTAKRSRMEEFEIDMESQTSELGKKLEVKDKDGLPGPARGLIKILSVTFKCFIWIATLGFKALMAIVAGLARCITSEKL